MIDNQEFAKIFSKNLRAIMYSREITQAQMSSELKIAKTTISGWMNGKRVPKMEKIDLLCSYLNCTRADLMEPQGSKLRKVVKGVKIPVLGRVAAGIPIEAITDILDYEEIPEVMSMTGEYFGLKIKGDSMLPRIAEGDVVIVRRQSDAESGQVVIAQVNGDSATCKKLVKHSSGISLVSFNPDYEPMFFSTEDVERRPVTIIGKVVENRQKY